jgi:hypothetical protein
VPQGAFTGFGCLGDPALVVVGYRCLSQPCGKTQARVLHLICMRRSTDTSDCEGTTLIRAAGASKSHVIDLEEVADIAFFRVRLPGVQYCLLMLVLPCLCESGAYRIMDFVRNRVCRDSDTITQNIYQLNSN